MTRLEALAFLSPQASRGNKKFIMQGQANERMLRYDKD